MLAEVQLEPEARPWALCLGRCKPAAESRGGRQSESDKECGEAGLGRNAGRSRAGKRREG